jgi:hypothetical protein
MREIPPPWRDGDLHKLNRDDLWPAAWHCAVLEHDPEKWKPVFRKDHAPPKSLSTNRLNLKRLRSEHRIAAPSSATASLCIFFGDQLYVAADHFCVPPTRLEKPDATATTPSAIVSPSDGRGRGAGPSTTAAPFFGS